MSADGGWSRSPLAGAALLVVATGSIALGWWSASQDQPVPATRVATRSADPTPVPVPPPPSPPPTPADVANPSPLAILQQRRLPGTDLIALFVGYREDEGSQGTSLFRATNAPGVRDLILLDSVTGASRRLLPVDDRRIMQAQFLADGPDPDPDAKEARPMAWFSLAVQPNDAGDDDPVDLVMGRLADGRQATVMTGITRVISLTSRDRRTVAALVRIGDRLFYRLIDMNALAVTGSTEVPFAL